MNHPDPNPSGHMNQLTDKEKGCERDIRLAMNAWLNEIPPDMVVQSLNRARREFISDCLSWSAEADGE